MAAAHSRHSEGQRHRRQSNGDVQPRTLTAAAPVRPLLPVCTALLMPAPCLSVCHCSVESDSVPARSVPGGRRVVAALGGDLHGPQSHQRVSRQSVGPAARAHNRDQTRPTGAKTRRTEIGAKHSADDALHGSADRNGGEEVFPAAHPGAPSRPEQTQLDRARGGRGHQGILSPVHALCKPRTHAHTAHTGRYGRAHLQFCALVCGRTARFSRSCGC